MLKLRFSKKEQTRQLVLQKIADQLAKSGGMAMKIGQVFADVGKNPAFDQLLTGIPQRPLSDMLSQLATAPRHPSVDDFLKIEKKAKAASLGQVHRAVLKNGDTVAVKIQYPEIRETIEQEMKLAGLIPAVGPAKKWSFDLNAYKKNLYANFIDELDYLSEAKRQSRFRNELTIDGLCIPEVFTDLCNSKVLVQSWEEGVYFDEILNWPKTDRMLIGRTLLMTLWQSYFVLGEVHGDPHMGNSYFRRDSNDRPEVVLLDFGCTISVSKTQRLAFLKLILDLRAGGEISPLLYFTAMGFDPDKLSHIEHELYAMSQILFKPFLLDEPFDVDSWQVNRGFELILGKRKWWFRSAGPADLFLMMRAFQGVIRQVSKLDAQLPWWGILKKAVGKEVLEAAERFEIQSDISYTKQPPIKGIVAGSLRIEITENDQPILNLSLPPDAALEMESLIPENVLKEMSSDAWSGDSLKEQLIATRLAPCIIFQKQSGNKNYKVWLE